MNAPLCLKLGPLDMPRKPNPVAQLITGAFKRHGAPFAKRLPSVHTSCVNALSWSGDGRWLASAGDDKHIVLWDFHPLDELSSPFVCSGPRGNVLCLAFSASNSYILSGGLDEEVLQYDVSRMSSTTNNPISRRFSEHEGSIRAISPHPKADHTLLTGSEDGLVILHDVRVPQRAHVGVGSLALVAEVTGVQYHPTMEHVFVTSDGAGNCLLRDTRMAFSSSGINDPKGLLQYVTTLSKPGSLRMSKPEVSSVVFDRTGTQLAVTMLNYLPTIFNVWDEWPLATCSGAALSPNPISHGEHEPQLIDRSYVNACTIKQGSFGGSGLHRDSYYGAGSDDFRGYVWDVPELAHLASRRRELSHAEWAASESIGGKIGFAKSATGRRVVPVELPKPHFLLYGHKSIVNTLLFHPQEPYIATSGVERHVFVHSPFEATATFGSLARTERQVRRLSERNAGQSHVSFNAPIEADDDDERMIALFDRILRQEGTADIWDTRRWSGDESEHSNSDLDLDPDADAESDEVQDGSQSED